MAEEDKYYHLVADVLKDVMKNFDMSHRSGKDARIRRSWSRIIGNRLCDKCSFVKVENHMLFIKANSRSFIQVLKMNRNGILRRYNELFPEDNIMAIDVRCDEGMYSN